MTTAIEVRERPILFSGTMIRAILDDRKSVTRRVVSKMVTDEGERLQCVPGEGFTPGLVRQGYRCPYGQPGDRLWVREAHAFVADEWGLTGLTPGVAYRAGGWEDDPYHQSIRWLREDGESALVNGQTVYNASKPEVWRWRPSIHMPRWASRITLEITDVRVERVQEISEEDAKAEGVERSDWAFSCEPYRNYAEPRRAPGRNCATALRSFQTLWDSINGPRGYGWDANPWVWVVSFRRVAP